jgi:hypothetical protein
LGLLPDHYCFLGRQAAIQSSAYELEKSSKEAVKGVPSPCGIAEGPESGIERSKLAN